MTALRARTYMTPKALIPRDLLSSLVDPAEGQEWQRSGLCAQTDPEAFFPEKGGSTREAKRICQGCAVRDECLEYALSNEERFGIWGGLSERERRRVVRERQGRRVPDGYLTESERRERWEDERA
jgi:WhiB family redox-sensing transcriptional regulator